MFLLQFWQRPRLFCRNSGHKNNFVTVFKAHWSLSSQRISIICMWSVMFGVMALFCPSSCTHEPPKPEGRTAEILSTKAGGNICSPRIQTGFHVQKSALKCNWKRVALSFYTHLLFVHVCSSTITPCQNFRLLKTALKHRYHQKKILWWSMFLDWNWNQSKFLSHYLAITARQCLWCCCWTFFETLKVHQASFFVL